MSATASRDDEGDGAISALPEKLNESTVDYVSAMSETGIEITNSTEPVATDPDCRYARIGFVAVWDAGGCSALYCADATAEQVGEVVRQAEATLLEGARGSMWRRIPDLGWERSVLEPVFSGISPIPRHVRDLHRYSER